MASNRQAIEITRRIPRQARATETVAVILEAAAQILETDGLEGFTTNAVAERAGVSIGTLYQYFANKNLLLLALAKQQMAAGLGDIARALQATAEASVEDRVRAVVRGMINAFRGRTRARKALTQAILAQNLGLEMLAPVASFIAQRPDVLAPALAPEQLFVVSRALMGAIRMAVLEEQPFLRSRRFEDEVVRLVTAYLSAITQG
jgi:AcrR family transcriptional regulator